MSDLKPCPFCGGKARMQREYDIDGFGNFHYIECDDCGAKSKRHFATSGNECPIYFGEVRDDWNMRADGWISVDERLPEIGTFSDYESHVVCLLENGERQICFILDDCGTWESCDVNTSEADVTHWMPLPGLPTK